MVEDDSSTSLIANYMARSHLGQEKLAVFQDRRSRRHEDQLPLIGIYSCLLCERRFSTKLQLNSHYRHEHEENVHNYERKGGVLVVWYPSRLVRKLPDFQDAYERLNHQNE